MVVGRKTAASGAVKYGTTKSKKKEKQIEGNHA
jgi:hypothetical protein